MGCRHDGRGTGGATHAGAVAVMVRPPDYLAQGVPIFVEYFSERVVGAEVLDLFLNFVYKFGDLGGECSGEGFGIAGNLFNLHISGAGSLLNLLCGSADELIKDFKDLGKAEGRYEVTECVNGILLYGVDKINSSMIEFLNQILTS